MPPRSGVIPTERRGRRSSRGWSWRGLLREWVERASIRLEPQRVFHKADTVVVKQKAQWRSAGAGQVTGSQTVASIFVIQENLIARVLRYDDLASALSAANLDESNETRLDLQEADEIKKETLRCRPERLLRT
jgi:hypothetical protein